VADVSGRIELRIQRLVLDGLPVDRRHAGAVRLAVEAELTRLLSEGGALAGGERGRVRAADVQFVPDAGPADLGRRIAGAVHGSLAGPPARGGGQS
jgi:hypothetical protein